MQKIKLDQLSQTQFNLKKKEELVATSHRKSRTT